MTPATERGRARRAELVEVAKSLFAERGYEGTSIDAVLEATGISRGALYHHFDSKEALFEAVFLDLEEEIGRRVLETTEGLTDPVDVLRTAGRAWIGMAVEPAIQQVVILDAPSVLGWEKWRSVEEAGALGMIKAVLAVLVADGRLGQAMLDPFAHVLLASLNELALLVARSENPRRALKTGAQAVDELVSRLTGG
jgi:AcrR family transcriptional regulator